MAGSKAVIGVRMSKAERMKLETLAVKSERNLSQVVRLLIRQAEMTGLSDIRVKALEQPANGEDRE